MESLKLKVTSKVLAQSKKAVNQEQIAITDPTDSLVPLIAQANKLNRICLIFAGALPLDLGDSSAIWRAHNSQNEAAFDALFEFLAKYPDQEFEFLCEIKGKI
ncbi:MAG: hypothetical protein HGA22_11795 [Clostridiales bacterium]|nr:hypothetical protein [Clostridiales bacterium]